MIKIRNLVPNVYYQHSRDFQLIGRLYELALAMVKTNSDLLYNLPFSENSDIMFLDLLSTTLGFKTLHNYNIDQLKALCSCLTEIIRNKGNILSIKKACNALLGAEGITGQIEIDDTDIKGKGLYIIVPQELSDTTLLRDLLDYTLPAGLTYNITKSFIIKTTIDTQIKVKNDLSQEALMAPWETSNIYDSYNLNDLVAPNALSTSGMMINSTIVTHCHTDIDNIKIEFEYKIIPSASSNEQSTRNIDQATATKIKITGVKCYFELNDSKIYLNKSHITKIEVPITLDDKVVVEIAEGAFSGCSGLESITLPFVGDKAHTPSDTYQYPFGYIFGTKSYDSGVATKQYYYGGSTNNITSSTYYIPLSLKEVVITNSIYIPYGAFYNCSSLIDIAIPNTITFINGSAFSNCYKLTNVTFKENSKLESIGSSAFWGCSGLTSIQLPSSVTSIGDSAFRGCSNLESIIVDSNNKYYTSRDSNNNECNCIIEKATNTLIVGCKNTIIPNSVTSIGKRAFEDCNSLTSITIPNSVTSIGEEAFYYCSSLTSIQLPNSVINISSSAFRYCSKLTSIQLSNSVESIGDRAFYGCYRLIRIDFNGTQAQWNSISKGSNWNKYTGNYTIYCKDGSIPKS